MRILCIKIATTYYYGTVISSDAEKKWKERKKIITILHTLCKRYGSEELLEIETGLFLFSFCIFYIRCTNTHTNTWKCTVHFSTWLKIEIFSARLLCRLSSRWWSKGIRIALNLVYTISIQCGNFQKDCSTFWES